MVNKLDFSAKLLSALTAYAASKAVHDEVEVLDGDYFQVMDSDGDFHEVSSPALVRLFVKAALALRAWYRHMALLERPELVVQETGSRFEVYGGTFVQRMSDGTLVLGNGGLPEDGVYLEVASLGQWLARKARHQVRLHYLAKAQDLIRNQGLDAATTRQLISALERVDDYVSYKLNVCWWRRTSTLASDGRVLGKLLWDSEVVDREVFSLAVRVAGIKFKVVDFNKVAAHRVALKARVSEAPHMARWLYSTDDFGDLHVHETVWKDLKESFLRLGGTQQAWRWLSNQGYNWFRSFRLDANDVAVLNHLAALQVGKAPMHLGLTWALRYRVQGGVPGYERFLDVFKAAVVAFKSGKLKMADFSNYNLIFDYLDNEPTAPTKGATWASLMRRQHVWHMEFARKEMERRKEEGGCLGWAPYVQHLTKGVLEAVSLNTSDDLWEEGALMNHCVGGYDQHCYKNTSRIYSIRRGEERVATLEIRKEDGRLTIGQLYGAGNTPIKDRAVVMFSKQVLSACKRMPEPDVSLNAVIREPKSRQPVQQLAYADADEIPF